MPWVLLIISIGLVFLIPTAYAGYIGAPWAPTRLPVVKRAFDVLEVGEGDTVIDLGAGDGKILREAGRRGAAGLGYELSPIMWAVAMWRTRGLKRLQMRFKNFYKETLPDATIVFAFLMPDNMSKVRALLARQHLPSAKYFLAYAFPLKDAQPLQVINSPKCAPLYVYDLKLLTTRHPVGNIPL
jgi:SAM-dependent methyltransferase